MRPLLSRRAWLALATAALSRTRANAATSDELRRTLPIALPRDFGAHPATGIEWWYLTGWLQAGAAADPTHGFQITFLRSRGEVAPDHPSRFAASQVLFAHAALSDLQAKRHLHAQRIARAGFGIAEAKLGDTDVRLRDWALQRHGPPHADAIDASSAHRYTSAVRTPDFALQLRFDATQPVLLQGEAGWSRKGPDPAHASLYLSEPQLAVHGTLERNGRREPVTGTGWLDHEWSDALLPPTAVGWDWAGINLDDGGALTVFQLRRADGSALWAGGSHRPRGGAVRTFAPGELRFTPLRRWTSAATGASYPVEWRIESPLGTHLLVAAFDAQELDSRSSAGTAYWEGLSELRDAHEARVGRGYLEMTGYAGRLRL
ncbi:lipocalin-like domain-containing protein [Rivibacter subsaxonicus]|uniref:Putative secreted hydrolase n=1 Tax=Rivibacter subsaxonicus TaxID=457575 RepID=A0A4Q7W299_9BURK|nr:carotenoid 1,2-hydratase [Rivibacter subsaxonicus]RZU03148.1 putative secreted hydrolase [Rivibacter subsaxonicus]